VWSFNAFYQRLERVEKRYLLRGWRGSGLRAAKEHTTRCPARRVAWPRQERVYSAHVSSALLLVGLDTRKVPAFGGRALPQLDLVVYADPLVSPADAPL
jgi:hypothetical protein